MLFVNSSSLPVKRDRDVPEMSSYTVDSFLHTQQIIKPEQEPITRSVQLPYWGVDLTIPESNPS